MKKVPPGFEEDLATNSGMLVMDHTTETKHFGGTWFDSRAITNVLSYALVRKQVGPNNIGYDAKKDLFWVKVGKHHFEFKRSKEGLYYYLPKSSQEDSKSFLEVQEETKRLYTPREFKQALKARKLIHTAGHPNPADLVKMVQSNQIINCLVKPRDFKVAQRIMGPDVSTLKGKTTRHKPVPMVQEMVELPEELTPTDDVELCIDIMKVNKISFLVTVSKRLLYRTCKQIKPIGNKKDSFNAALDEVFRVYNQNGCTIAVIHADREFKPLLQSLEDDKSVELNLAAANKHVPEIDRTNRVFKERLRACYHRLPYKNLHRALLIAMVEDCAFKANFFPVKAGLS